MGPAPEAFGESAALRSCLQFTPGIISSAGRLRLDVAFQFGEDSRVLLSEGGCNQRLRHLEEAGYLDGEIESADEGGRAFDRLEGASDMNVNVCRQWPARQPHGLMKGDVFRRIVARDGAG